MLCQLEFFNNFAANCFCRQEKLVLVDKQGVVRELPNGISVKVPVGKAVGIAILIGQTLRFNEIILS